MSNEGIAISSLGCQRLRWLVLRTLLGAALFILHSTLLITPAWAQYNIDRLITIGRSALYYEDYVLSIQYFNQAIAAKPYLYEPWFFRGVAKYYLDDFVSAESDCTEALKRNPYVVNIYELRGLCRIQQKKYSAAIDDYTRALKYSPENQGLWHNRVLCHLQDSNYTEALAELDTMLTRWPKYARGYAMQAQAYMMQTDTTSAIAALDKSLEHDPYEGETWIARAIISLSRSEWKESEQFLGKAIHLMPRNAVNYINRALARYHQNNLRGAMADYDTALDLDPNNFLGHYNRGLLRAQVGDDNRGIEDFDFVLRLEPDNLMALFNRALLRDNTGDLQGAISDYSAVIKQYPNFWTGRYYRARCYRRIGMSRQAELDEFAVLKAQMDKRYGKPSKATRRQTRKRSDDDLEKYNQLVVADEEEVQPEYKSVYRGRVQNRKVDMDFMPMYGLTLEQPASTIGGLVVHYERQTEAFNRKSGLPTVFISCQQSALSEKRTKECFALIGSLNQQIDSTRQMARVAELLLHRAVAYATIQNFESAIDDLNAYLQLDSASTLAYWQRALCQSRVNEFHASQGINVSMKQANVFNDLTLAIAHNDTNPYLYYNRGNLNAQMGNYTQAISDYSRAIALDPQLAEAYYNRGLAYINSHQEPLALADLSKAGELGLYTAYSIIKKYSK